MKVVLLILLTVAYAESGNISVTNPVLNFQPCLSNFLKSTYNYGTYRMGEENQYIVGIHRFYTAGTIALLQLSSDAIVELYTTSTLFAVISPMNNNIYIFMYTANCYVLEFTVKSLNGVVPYFKSLIINDIEECQAPIVNYLDKIVENSALAARVKSSLIGQECGKRKIKSIELIISGATTTPGEWPWHVAIYRHERATNRYICGGTLITKLFVLTAAHCVTINNAPVTPDILSVVLGKYHLMRDDVSSERREISFVKVHDDFGSPQRLDNDIALLKLKTEAVYTDYVQPACLWPNNLNVPTQILGSVVGWGYSDDSENLSPELKHATMPMISDEQCIKSNAVFYGTMLQNNRKFCAGWGNGTSPCNGDSGSGYLVYVPDNTNIGSTGTWYVRGITSMTTPSPGTTSCDPEKYVVFTDASKYLEWIQIKAFENTIPSQ